MPWELEISDISVYYIWFFLCVSTITFFSLYCSRTFFLNNELTTTITKRIYSSFPLGYVLFN